MILNHKNSEGFEGLLPKRLVFEIGGGAEAASDSADKAAEAEAADDGSQDKAEGDNAISRQLASLGQFQVEGPKPGYMPEGDKPKERPIGLSPSGRQAHQEVRVLSDLSAEEAAQGVSDAVAEAAPDHPDDVGDELMKDPRMKEFTEKAGKNWRENNQLFAETFGLEGQSDDYVRAVIMRIQENLGLERPGKNVDGKWGETTGNLWSIKQSIGEAEEYARGLMDESGADTPEKA